MGEMADWELERAEARSMDFDLGTVRRNRNAGIDFSHELEMEEAIMAEQEQGVADYRLPGVELAQEAKARRAELQAALDEAKAECERLRAVIGWGPYVVVRLPQGGLRQLAEGQQVRVTVGGGQGVTQHLVGEVLELGVQTVRQTLGPEPAPEQLRERASALLTEASQAEGYTER
jgi:hypothetical protein